MLGTFLEKLASLFERNFIIPYWAPAFVGLLIAVGLITIGEGPGSVDEWWDKRSGAEKAAIVAFSLIGSAVAAYMMQALTVTIVRVYEGYWPGIARLFADWARESHRKRINDLKVEARHRNAPELYTELHFNFPTNPESLRPTSLGNVLAAAEDYPRQMYCIDAPLWWPRLAIALPGEFVARVDGAVTPMVALLNLATFFLGIALIGGATMWWFEPWPVSVGTFLCGLALAWLCYRAAVGQAMLYGDLVRVAFDLYRQEILRQMGIRVPANYRDERLLWTA